jgi:hypothetical protein
MYLRRVLSTQNKIALKMLLSRLLAVIANDFHRNRMHIEKILGTV